MATLIGTSAFEIEGAGGIRGMADLHRRLLAVLRTSSVVTIGLAGVTDPDVTLIQLIEAARHYAATNGIGLRLRSPAKGELRRQLERGGFVSRPVDRDYWFGCGEARQ